MYTKIQLKYFTMRNTLQMKKIILSLVLVVIFSLTIIFSHSAYADTYIQKLIDPSGGPGVVVDSSNNVYISKLSNGVAKYDSNGKFITKWGIGSGAVYGLGIDSSGNVYVVDSPNNRILKFDSNGSPLATWGINGSQNGQFHDPRGVATDKSGNIYVADTGNYRIEKLDSNGNFITTWTLSKTSKGQLEVPYAIAVDSLGNVYAADYSYNGGIQKFDSNGNPLATIGGGSSFSDITIDSHNIIYADGKKFDSNGTLLGSISFPWSSQGIAVDSKGNIYSGGYELVFYDSPVVNSQTLSTNQNSTLAIHLTGSVKSNSNLSFSIKSYPSSGKLVGSNTDYVYTPYPSFSGNDSFTFTANDGYQNGNTGTISITVSRVDHRPTATSSVGSVNENTPLQIVLSGNDIDNNKITYAIGTNPLHGTLGGFNSTNGYVIYTPNRDYVGNDNFAFTTSNRSFQSTIATFTLTVNPVSYTPTAIVGSEQTISGGSTVSLDGSGSIDPYYDIIMKNYNFGQKQPIGNFLKYSWAQTGGIPVTLSSKTVSNPTFVAPTTSSGMILSFTLTVTDQGSNTSSPVTITIQSSSVPVQNATRPATNNTVSVPTISNTGITVSTDKSSYNRGDTVTILGKLSSNIPNQAITIRVLNGFQNPVDIALLAPAPDGSVTTKLLATGPLWQTSGTYTIMAQYNSTIKTLTAFYFNAGNVTSSANNVTNTQSTPTTTSQQFSQTTPTAIAQSTTIITPTPQDIQNINQAKTSQTIAAEVNVGVNQAQTTSIDNTVSVQTTSSTPDSLNVNVSAPNQTAPKVIMFDLPATTNVANLKDLGVMYDGKPISPAPNIDAILHAKSTDNPSFAIVVTQSGVQVLVLVPHFSTHTITITNMSKVIPVVPEFPLAIVTLIIATFSIVLIPKMFST